MLKQAVAPPNVRKVAGRRKTSAMTDDNMKREVLQNPALTASALKKKHPDLLNTVSIRTIQHRLQKNLPTRRPW